MVLTFYLTNKYFKSTVTLPKSLEWCGSFHYNIAPRLTSFHWHSRIIYASIKPAVHNGIIKTKYKLNIKLVVKIESPVNWIVFSALVLI